MAKKKKDPYKEILELLDEYTEGTPEREPGYYDEGGE